MSAGLKLLTMLQEDPVKFIAIVQKQGKQIGDLFGIWETKLSEEKKAEVIMLVITCTMLATFISKKLGVPKEMLAGLIMQPDGLGIGSDHFPFSKETLH